MADTPAIAHGFARCEKPDRYLQQLVKHWSHKMDAVWAQPVATFPFSEVEHAVMTARDDGIAITLTTAEQDRNEHMRGVIERHIDRFAFREAPLDYEWKNAEEA